MGLQRQLLYAPDKAMGRPSTYGLDGFEAVELTSADGTRLTAWLRAAREGRPTLVYFHGNAGHLGNRADLFQAFARRGLGVMALSYRGYGVERGLALRDGPLRGCPRRDRLCARRC